MYEKNPVLVMENISGNPQIKIEYISKDTIPESLNGESGYHVYHVRMLTELILNQLVKDSDDYNLTAEDIEAISVEDNGVGIPPEKLETLQQLLQANPLSTVDMPYRALININDRIRITYGQEYGVSLESIPGKRTRTMIRLPITKE